MKFLRDFVDAKLAKNFCKNVAQIIYCRNLSCLPFKQTADGFFKHQTLYLCLLEFYLKIFRRQLSFCKFKEHAQEIIIFGERHLVLLVQIIKEKLTPIYQKRAMRVVKAFLIVYDILTSMFHNQGDYLSRYIRIFFPETCQKLKQINSVLIIL